MNLVNSEENTHRKFTYYLSFPPLLSSGLTHWTKGEGMFFESNKSSFNLYPFHFRIKHGGKKIKQQIDITFFCFEKYSVNCLGTSHGHTFFLRWNGNSYRKIQSPSLLTWFLTWWAAPHLRIKNQMRQVKEGVWHKNISRKVKSVYVNISARSSPMYKANFCKNETKKSLKMKNSFHSSLQLALWLGKAKN